MKHMSTGRIPRSTAEIERIRYISRARLLRLFASKPATWELLFVVAQHEGDGSFGINDYIDRLKTLSTTRLTIYNFIKDRIDDGSLVIAPSLKKSRKSLALSDELRAELNAYFEWIEAPDNAPAAPSF